MPDLRAAQRADLPGIVEIYNHAVAHSYATFDTEPATVESRAGWFAAFGDSGPHRLLVAVEDGRVTGWASSSPYRAHPAFARTVELTVYVHPHLRAAGVGSALYAALLSELRAQDLHLAVAGIALPNEPSVALHRKFGFTEVGVFDEYATKHDQYISSLWMQRRLA